MVDMTLPPLPEESFQRVLCVVAHPDDMEYGTSAAVAQLDRTGHRGRLPPAHPRRGRHAQPTRGNGSTARRRAARRLRGRRRHTPDRPATPRRCARLRPGPTPRHLPGGSADTRPDVVLGTGYDIETPYGFDQADHRAAGLATLDAIRDAGNRWVFPEQIEDEDLAPHTVRWYIVPGLAGSATHGVEVTGEPLRRGVASLEAHTAYLAALPDHPAPQEDIIPTFTAVSGKAMGVEHAVLFRAHDLQAPFELSRRNRAELTHSFARPAHLSHDSFPRRWRVRQP